MLGKWLRTSRPSEPEQPVLATPPAEQPVLPTPPPEPTDDDLATILALVVVSDHDLGMIMQRTHLATDLATAAVAELDRRRIVTDAGGGFYKAAQASCPGTCWRGGHELSGQEIVITPPGFEWWCAPCWEAERASASAPAGD
jgi:hypothetical protein